MSNELVKQPRFSAKPPVASFWRPSLGQKIGGLFLLLLLVAAGNIVVVKSMLGDMNDVAATLNVVGKLRMLSQKIAFDTADATQQPTTRNEAVARSIQDFEAILHVLEYGGTVFGYDIVPLGPAHQQRLLTVRRDWRSYRAYIDAWLAPPGGTMPHQFGSLADAAATILADAETLISFVVADTQRAQRRGMNQIYALLLLDTLVLVAAFIAIRRKIVRPLHELAGYCGQLAAGNYDVRTCFRSSDEIGQLALAFNQSAQRIGELMESLKHERQSLVRAETMFRQLAENAGVGVYIIKDHKLHFANARMADMFGYTPREAMNSLSIFDIVADEDRHAVEDTIARQLRGELQQVHYERRARRKDGTLFDVEVFGSTMRLDGDDRLIGVMLDITKRKQDERQGRLAALVYQHTSEAIMITDAIGNIVNINPAFTEITGYSAHEAIGRNIRILQSGIQDEAFYQAMWEAINTDGKWRGELWNRRKNGELYAERLTINTSYRQDGTVYRRIGLFSDITDKKQSESLIWTQANFDSLTGLPNRMMFHDRLRLEIQKSRRAGLPMALMFLDLDNFKEINDTLGHDVGDQLLQLAAQRLRNCVRGSDLVARLGGDEFTLILGELADIGVVERIARKILEALADPFPLADEALYISASLGITFYPDDGTEPEELLKNADQAMYAAKECGRNRHSYFMRSMQEAAQNRRLLARDLRVALAEGQFRLHYQPIVDLATARIEKAEALIRWQHPERGLVNPDEFIPIAEDTGLINAIGDWVFHEAARQALEWRNSGWPRFQISINTSAAQFRRDGIRAAEWLTWLERLGLSGDGIVIEITEGLLMDAGTGVSNTLLALRNAGIAVSIDDFGTGYSSLAYLKRFHIDYLKIDQTFVRNLELGSADLALCEAIIVMAHKLGIKVIAEGVETVRQRDLLAGAGCDYAQGYLFSKAMAPADFLTIA